MDLMQIRAWMAEHVFLTVGIAVVATIVIILLARDTVKNFHLRLFQISSLSSLALAGMALYVGAVSGDRNVMIIGAAVAVSSLIGLWAGWRLHEDLRGKLKNITEKHDNHQKQPIIRVAVDTPPAGGSKKA